MIGRFSNIYKKQLGLSHQIAKRRFSSYISEDETQKVNNEWITKWNWFDQDLTDTKEIRNQFSDRLEESKEKYYRSLDLVEKLPLPIETSSEKFSLLKLKNFPVSNSSTKDVKSLQTIFGEYKLDLNDVIFLTDDNGLMTKQVVVEFKGELTSELKEELNEKINEVNFSFKGKVMNALKTLKKEIERNSKNKDQTFLINLQSEQNETSKKEIIDSSILADIIENKTKIINGKSLKTNEKEIKQLYKSLKEKLLEIEKEINEKNSLEWEKDYTNRIFSLSQMANQLKINLKSHKKTLKKCFEEMVLNKEGPSFIGEFLLTSTEKMSPSSLLFSKELFQAIQNPEHYPKLHKALKNFRRTDNGAEALRRMSEFLRGKEQIGVERSYNFEDEVDDILNTKNKVLKYYVDKILENSLELIALKQSKDEIKEEEKKTSVKFFEEKKDDFEMIQLSASLKNINKQLKKLLTLIESADFYKVEKKVIESYKIKVEDLSIEEAEMPKWTFANEE